MLQKMCRISPQRWNHWIQFYDKKRRGTRGWLPSLLRRFQKDAESKVTPPHSAALTAI